MKAYKKYFKEANELKYFLIPEVGGDYLQYVDYDHDEFASDYFEMETDSSADYDHKALSHALQMGWIRVYGYKYILHFECYGYDNKTFKRIFKALKNPKIGKFSNDIEVHDAKDNKKYRYYGTSLKPIKEATECVKTN